MKSPSPASHTTTTPGKRSFSEHQAGEGEALSRPSKRRKLNAPRSDRPTLADLPEDSLREIFRHLTLAQIAPLRLQCRSLSLLADQEKEHRYPHCLRFVSYFHEDGPLPCFKDDYNREISPALLSSDLYAYKMIRTLLRAGLRNHFLTDAESRLRGLVSWLSLLPKNSAEYATVLKSLEECRSQINGSQFTQIFLKGWTSRCGDSWDSLAWVFRHFAHLLTPSGCIWAITAGGSEAERIALFLDGRSDLFAGSDDPEYGLFERPGQLLQYIANWNYNNTLRFFQRIETPPAFRYAWLSASKGGPFRFYLLGLIFKEKGDLPNALYYHAAAAIAIEQRSALRLRQLDPSCGDLPTDTLSCTQAAADTGNPFAQYDLARIYEKGELLENDLSRALDLIQASAAQGVASAQCHLAKLYESGERIEQDFQQAAHFYIKAAEQGHADAQFYLGRMYARGLGVCLNKSKAFDWFSEAAVRGHVFAQYAQALLVNEKNPAFDWTQPGPYEWLKDTASIWPLAKAKLSSLGLLD